MRGDSHVRCGGRAGETSRERSRNRAPVRPLPPGGIAGWDRPAGSVHAGLDNALPTWWPSSQPADIQAQLALIGMSNETSAKVWLYQDGDWRLADDPVHWNHDGADDVRAKYAEAGYSDLHGAPAAPFLLLGLNSEENTSSGAQLTLFVRHEHPQCLIDIEGQSGATRPVYAARLPDGLDLLARWAAIVSAAALTAVVGG